MNIAIFTDTFIPEVNGVANTLGRWVRYLEARGVNCKVFAPDAKGKDKALCEQVVERFRSIPFFLYPECNLAVPRPLYMSQKLIDFAPTLIHVATPFNLGLFGHHFARKHQIPLVASYHTNFDQYLPHYKLTWVQPLLHNYMLWFHQTCDKTYVPSQSTLEHLLQHGYSNLEIWGRGIDTNAFRPREDRSPILSRYQINPDKFILLYVGRLAPEKGIDTLLQAFNLLPDRVKGSTHLLFVGDGPLYSELQQSYASDPSITFLGFKNGNELRELYAAADAFFFPSPTETFGNVVLESMASGTPVIGASAGGVKNLVEHNKTGLLCEPGDRRAFAEAVTTLFDDPLLRQRLALSARKYSLTQSWEQIFAQLLDSYQDVIIKNGQAFTGSGRN